MELLRAENEAALAEARLRKAIAEKALARMTAPSPAAQLIGTLRKIRERRVRIAEQAQAQRLARVQARAARRLARPQPLVVNRWLKASLITAWFVVPIVTILLLEK
jgi:hypothetical protein